MNIRFVAFVVGLIAIIINGQDFSELIAKLQKNVVPIKFTIKRISRGASEYEFEMVQRAIVISDDLIVVTDASVITNGDGSGVIVSASESYTSKSLGRSSTKPKFARVYIGKELEVPAKFLGLNKDYDLAYFKLIPKPNQKIDLKPLEVVDDTKINIKPGDEVYKLNIDVRARKFGFPFHIAKEVVSYKFEGSGHDFSVGFQFEIIVDKDLQVLGFGFESPITRKSSKGDMDYSTSGLDDSMDSSRYGLLFTKSKLIEIVKGIPKEKRVGWLGFLPGSVEKIETDLKEDLGLSKELMGLRVSDVPKNSPAYNAGLKIDDIILEIGGRKTVFQTPQEASDFSDWLDTIDINKKYEVKFLRKENGKYVEKETAIVTIEKPVYFDDIEETEFKVFGVKVKPLTYDYKYNNRLPDDIKGLVIILSKRGDPFSTGGINVGDIILAIGTQKDGLQDIDSIDDFKNILKKLKNDKPEEIIVKIYTGSFIVNQWAGSTKEIKLKTVRLNDRNYKDLEKDLE